MGPPLPKPARTTLVARSKTTTARHMFGSNSERRQGDEDDRPEWFTLTSNWFRDRKALFFKDATQEITIEANGVILRGGYWKAKSPSDLWVIFYSGSHSPAAWYTQPSYCWKDYYNKKNVNFVSVDYRGFGASTTATFKEEDLEDDPWGMDGITLSEKELSQDALAVYAYVVTQLLASPPNIILHGYSMGAFPATHICTYMLLHNVHPRALILDRPMTNTAEAVEGAIEELHGEVTSKLVGRTIGWTFSAITGKFSIEKRLFPFRKDLPPIVLLLDCPETKLSESQLKLYATLAEWGGVPGPETDPAVTKNLHREILEFLGGGIPMDYGGFPLLLECLQMTCSHFDQLGVIVKLETATFAFHELLKVFKPVESSSSTSRPGSATIISGGPNVLTTNSQPPKIESTSKTSPVVQTSVAVGTGPRVSGSSSTSSATLRASQRPTVTRSQPSSPDGSPSTSPASSPRNSLTPIPSTSSTSPLVKTTPPTTTGPPPIPELRKLQAWTGTSLSQPNLHSNHVQSPPTTSLRTARRDHPTTSTSLVSLTPNYVVHPRSNSSSIPPPTFPPPPRAPPRPFAPLPSPGPIKPVPSSVLTSLTYEDEPTIEPSDGKRQLRKRERRVILPIAAARAPIPTISTNNINSSPLSSSKSSLRASQRKLSM